jgi:hypothetical protein
MRTQCPECRLSWELFPPARVQERVPEAERKDHNIFRDGPFVRCVGCKKVYDGDLQDDDGAEITRLAKPFCPNCECGSCEQQRRNPANG